VLITGTSSGIGAACALAFDEEGFRVFAGVRKEADGRRLRERASERLVPLMIDVTEPASIRAAVEQVGASVGDSGLAGLVNNAAIVVPGPLELVPTGQFRRLLEVNVLGTHAVTQAFLPLLRIGSGRIVIIGSILGQIASPYLGAYVASKYALEAMADSLRMELRTWRISVSIVEPDSVQTPIWDKLHEKATDLAPGGNDTSSRLYEEELRQMWEATERLAASGVPAQRVVRAVRHALFSRRPKTRYPIGLRARLAGWASRNLSSRTLDWLMLRILGLH